ncbi:hypothetical protein AY586_14705 [Marichromatium gracile]|uniref:Uncharacterized protein n=2 Tax=Marichromatium gracile TaxID=1048 RepID=A0ABR5VFN1_MARGR|nr:hypothetical protein AY586_14705 [Marichromatium gracile]
MRLSGGRVAMIEVRLPYPPGANRLWRVARGKVIATDAAKNWKRETALRAKVAGVRPTKQAVAVEMVLHPRLTAKGVASQTRLDVDAPIKVTLDALQDVAYADDRQVLSVSSRIGSPIRDGGLTVRISAA